MTIGPVKSIEKHIFFKTNGDVTVRLDIETVDGEHHVMRLSPQQWTNLVQNTVEFT